MAPIEDLKLRLQDAFAADLSTQPAMSLRAADSIDSYRETLAFDAEADRASTEYLNQYAWGIPHLDPMSWRHYLPVLGSLALDSLSTESAAVRGFIESLRPPDRDPPRLASLSARQEAVVRELLEALAFSQQSIWQEEACRALEEWWMEDPLFRSPGSRRFT